QTAGKFGVVKRDSRSGRPAWEGRQVWWFAAISTEAFLLAPAGRFCARANPRQMFSITRTRTSAGRFGAYVVTVPAIGLALWAALLMARTSARPLAVTPFALAIALSAGYGGLGPGLFALVQAAVAIDVF